MNKDLTLRDSKWAGDRVDRVGQGINTKVNDFRSSGNTCSTHVLCGASFSYVALCLKIGHGRKSS